MPDLFLDPRTPIHTCTAGSCSGCACEHTLTCHFTPGRLLLFLAMALPVFLLAGHLLNSMSPYLLLPWGLCVVAFFGFVEIRVMCSHCPHYAEPATRNLKCWANYGSPKLWRWRPGPMSRMEKIVFYAGFAVLFAPPLVVGLVQARWVWAAVYAALLVAWKLGIKYGYCIRCFNFACPFNSVLEPTRQAFLAANPSVREAWQRSDTPCPRSPQCWPPMRSPGS